MFVLVIGGTEVCRIPGISMAGSSPHAVPFTAPADAEVLWWGRGERCGTPRSGECLRPG